VRDGWVAVGPARSLRNLGSGDCRGEISVGEVRRGSKFRVAVSSNSRRSDPSHHECAVSIRPYILVIARVVSLCLVRVVMLPVEAALPQEPAIVAIEFGARSAYRSLPCEY